MVDSQALSWYLTFDMDSWNVDLKVASSQNFWHFALLLLYPNTQKGYEGRHPWNVENVLLRYHHVPGKYVSGTYVPGTITK